MKSFFEQVCTTDTVMFSIDQAIPIRLYYEINFFIICQGLIKSTGIE